MDIVAITDSSNNIISTITHSEGIDQPLSISDGTDTYYYLRDHQGSVIALVDSSGTKVEEYSYDAYGKVTSKNITATTHNPYGYTGRVMDDDDLYYYRARYYDPTVQRFLSEDPIGFGSGDFNFYRYVMNNPTNWIDPFGYNGYGYAVTFSEWMLGVIATDTAIPDPFDIAWPKWAGYAIAGTIAGGIIYFAKSKESGKAKASDAPSWAKGKRPKPKQRCQDFAKQLMDEKYGCDNWPKGPGTEYNKIVKWCQRSLK